MKTNNQKQATQTLQERKQKKIRMINLTDLKHPTQQRIIESVKSGGSEWTRRCWK